MTKIEPGFWNCCQAKPTKIVAFYETDGPIVWHYACAGCASTVHPSRVQDATYDLYEVWYQETTVTIAPDMRLLTVTEDKDAAADIAQQLREQFRAVAEVRVQPSIPRHESDDEQLPANPY